MAVVTRKGFCYQNSSQNNVLNYTRKELKKLERNKVILVDKNDQPLGEMEKLNAHIEGRLHRAFSIFIFNDQGELLLQQRAKHKYHGGGLWTNTCCSHPQPQEHDTKASAVQRLQFEMGLHCELKWVYSFIYQEKVENNLTEHELDHVYIGYSNEEPTLNEDEVQDYKWLDPAEVLADIKSRPAHYTVWFKQAFPKLLQKMGIVSYCQKA